MAILIEPPEKKPELTGSIIIKDTVVFSSYEDYVLSPKNAETLYFISASPDVTEINFLQKLIIATNTGNIDFIVAKAFLGSTKIYDQLDYPTLDLNFALTKSLDPRITFTRASSGTYFDSNGVLQTASANTPRFDHNPFTGESLGLLIEEQRTNLLLNSATLSTQSVTVTNVAHTLSFYGTGTIVLSGAHSATVNGTGVFPTRTTLTFTPTAGTLTLTVSGTVQYAQLEPGSFATSRIPTSGAVATRAADVATMTGTNFSSWYRQDEGTFFVDVSIESPITITRSVIDVNRGTPGYSPRHQLTGWMARTGASQYAVVDDAGVVAVGGLQVAGATTRKKLAFTFAANDFISATDGLLSGKDIAGTPPTTVAQLTLGQDDSGAFFLNGHIRRIAYYPRRLANSELQLLTT